MDISMTELQKCNRCVLKELDKNKEAIPAGWGNSRKIFIVGLAPSDSREKSYYAMKPVSDKDTANILMEVLEKVELRDFYITNLVKCSFKDNKLDKSCFDICFNNWLIKELVTINPKIIVCLGNDVYEYLKSKPQLSMIYDIRKVWHHAYISRNNNEKTKEEWRQQWVSAILL